MGSCGYAVAIGRPSEVWRDNNRKGEYPLCFTWSGNGSIHFLLLDAWSEGYDNVRVG